MSHRGVYTKRYGLGSHLSLNLDTYDVCVQPAYAVAPHVDDTTVLDGIRDVADEHVYAEARTRFAEYPASGCCPKCQIKFMEAPAAAGRGVNVFSVG